MKTPLLTVAIPTYNRSRNLESIIKGLKSQKAYPSFAILISDDCSTDDTEQMVKRYMKEMPNLVYHKNENNVGYSGNVCMLYELAKTKYVWFLCDDDTVLPGAVQEIVNAIIKYKPTVAVFNCTWINPYGQRKTAGVSEDKVHDNKKNFSDYQLFVRLTFLSIIVVEKKLSIEKIKKSNYKDNIFFQLTLSLLLLNDKFRYCEIAYPIIHRNVGYKYGEFLKFSLVDQLKAELLIKTSFDKKKFIQLAKLNLFSNFALYFSQKVGLFRYYGRPTKETIVQVIKYFDIYCVPIFLCMLLYPLTPRVLVKSVYFLRLLTFYQYKEAIRVYKKMVDRAYIDKRQTGFTSYK